MKIAIFSAGTSEGRLLEKALWSYLDSIKAEDVIIDLFTSEDIFLRSYIQEPPDTAFFMLPGIPDAFLLLARRLHEAYPRVVLVFTGQQAEQALTAYQAGAVYYLMPPFSWTELAHCHKRCSAFHRRHPHSLKIVQGRTPLTIPFERLMYMRVERKTTRFFLYENSLPIIVHSALSTLISQLSEPRFLQSYRSCIINMDFINEFRSDSVIMADGTILPIRKRDSKRLRSSYQTYILSQSPSTNTLLTNLTHYKERLRIAMQAARICVFEVLLQHQRYTFFENAESLFGVSGDVILADVAAFAKLPPAQYRHAVSAYFSHPEDAPVIAAAYHEILAGRSTSYEARMKAGSTKFIWCRIDVQPVVEDGIPTRMIGVITAMRRRHRKRTASAMS